MTLKNFTHSFKPDTTITDERRVWAAAHLAELPTRIVFGDMKVQKGHDPSGNLFRQAYAIIVIPGRDFLIRLYKGASDWDLRQAKRFVEHAKEGLFNSDMWTAHNYGRHGDGFYFSNPLLWDGKKHRDRLKPCTVIGCVDDFHGWVDDGQDGRLQNDPCRTEAIKHPHGYYIVRGWRFCGEEWSADVSNDHDCFPEGAAGLKAIRDLANDFAWVHEECSRLNEQLEDSK